MKVSAIVPAAGRGERFKSRVSKTFFRVSGRPLLVWTLQNLLNSRPFEEIIVMAHPRQRAGTVSLLKRYRLKNVRVEEGGGSRAESVKRGLLALSLKADWVLVHDAARPLVSKSLVSRTLFAAQATGAAICAVPVTATVKKIDLEGAFVVSTEDRRILRLAQTPQIFRRELLLSRYRILGAKAFSATDEAALFDQSAIRVNVVKGDEKNIKVTTRGDLEMLKYFIAKG